MRKNIFGRKAQRVCILGIIILIALGMVPTNSAWAATVLKFSSHYQVGTPAEQGIALWAKLVKERTKGRVEIQHFPASQLGKYKDMVEMTRIGSVQGATTNAGGLGLLYPEFSVLVCPFLFRDSEHYAKVVKGPIGKALNEKLVKTTGLRALAMNWYWGLRHLTANKPIYRPENLQGMKIRTPDSVLYVQAIKAMGATPTPMDITEVYTSLKTGVIDGQENPPDNVKTYNLQEVQKYLVMTGHILELQINFVNERFWQSLSPGDRNIIAAAMIEAEDWQNATLMKKEQESLVWLQEVGGMIVTIPDREAFRTAASKFFPGQFQKDWGDTYKKIQDVR
jgi:tripartite ATP-independent transporter DctP family solute receptor